MSSLKEIKLAQKSILQQQQLIAEFEILVRDIERCEKTITDLQQELTQVNLQYPGPRTSQQDVDYLTALLKCANKKLVWEKHVASVQKRTPVLLDKMTQVMDDPANPAAPESRAQIVRTLQGVQAAVARLQSAVNG